MSEGAKTLRLSKVAKEFNLSLGKIVEFLGAKGHPVDSNPNAKIGDEEYRLLLKEFSSDKSAREEAESAAQNSSKLKRETIVLDEIKPKKQKDEEVDEVVIKDLTLSKKVPEVIEKPEVKKETPVSIEPPVIKKEVETNEGPKVIGKVDLDSMNLKTKPDKKTKKEKDAEKTSRAEVEADNAAKAKRKKEEDEPKEVVIQEKAPEVIEQKKSRKKNF